MTALEEFDRDHPRPYFCRCQHPMEAHHANPDSGATCRWCDCTSYIEDRRLVAR